MSLLELFCTVDDLWLGFEPQWKTTQLQAGKRRERKGQLCPSEVMTILIHFHQSHYRTFNPHFALIFENKGGKPVLIVEQPLSSTAVVRLASRFGF